MEEAMKVTNLTRVFKGAGGEFTALKNINLSIPAGKLTILKGRSGSGKTTLMNILGTLDEPTSGSVMLNGMELTTLSEPMVTSVKASTKRAIIMITQAH